MTLIAVEWAEDVAAATEARSGLRAAPDAGGERHVAKTHRSLGTSESASWVQWGPNTG